MRGRKTRRKGKTSVKPMGEPIEQAEEWGRGEEEEKRREKRDDEEDDGGEKE